MTILNFFRKLAIFLSYGLLGLLSAAVFLFSLVTAIRFRQYEQNDLFDIVWDNTPLLLASMAAVLAVTGLVLWRMDRLPHAAQLSFQLFPRRSTKRTAEWNAGQAREKDRPAFPWPMMIFAGAMSLFLVLVIRGNATNDALQLDEIMQAFSSGDYGALGEGGYLFVYPFQITYVFIGQLIAALCGASNYLVYQLLNVVSILCNLYFLYRITWELFHSEKVCAVMQILSMGCWFYYVFATFVYADLWSFAVQTAALFLEICYLNRRRLRYEVGAGICIAAATLLKTNCYIALVAMVLILLMDAVRKDSSGTSGQTVPVRGVEKPCQEQAAEIQKPGDTRHRLLRAAFLAVMVVAMTKGAQIAVNAAAAKTAGMEKMPSGVPAAAYFAMGMQETEGKYGWYNGTNVGLFREAGYDPKETIRAAKSSMEESIGEFRNSKRYLIRFYVGKFLSQWGDPTCVSMREMEETRRHTGDLPWLVSSLIFGSGSRILQWGMNVTHSLIYLGLFLYVVSMWRRKRKAGRWTVSDAETLIVLFIVGGMLFHQLWEASGRYTMRYYLTMLPLSAFGICRLLEKLQETAERGLGSRRRKA